MVNATNFRISNIFNQPRCPPTNNLIKNMLYIKQNTTKQLKNKIMSFVINKTNVTAFHYV